MRLLLILVIFSSLAAPTAMAADTTAPGNVTGTSSAEEGRKNLAMAWQYFNDKNYEYAVSLFLLAEKYPESNLEARFGLALSNMKLGNKKDASEGFSYLIEKGYKTADVLPPLMWLLLEEKGFNRARKYLSMAEDNEQKAQWASMIDAGLLEQRVEVAIKKKRWADLLTALKEKRNLLSECTAPYVFFNSARALSGASMADEAREIHKDILNYCPGDTELRGLALSEINRLEPPADTLSRIKRERVVYAHDSDYMERLDVIEKAALTAMLKNTQPGSEEALQTMKRISEISPEDIGMLSKLSWDSFNAKKYEQAAAGFSRLRETDPANPDYALGLAYSLLALKRNDEALRIADEFRGTDKRFADIYANSLAGLGRAAYEKKDYKAAIGYYQMLLEIDPDNEEALSLTAWSHFNAGDSEKALPYFRKKFQRRKDPAYVMPLMSIFERTDLKRARAFAKELADSDDAEASKALSDYYNSKGRPITAAQVALEGPESCYYNADKPWVEAAFSIRNKSGDPGLSKLRELDTLIAGHYPLRGGRELSISVKYISLDSESTPPNVFAGSYFTGVPQPHGMTTSASLIEPELTFKQEGRISYSLAVGSSPVGGEASIKPTFAASVRSSWWAVELHRSPVRDSILSYSGSSDPYGPAWWGGVLRSGIKGSLSLSPFQSYTLYIEAGYDSYDGENVIDNQSFSGTIAFGRSLDSARVNIFVGVAATAMSFDTNTNFFTIGHGGYFSPQSFLSVGPSVRISSNPCRSLWFDALASVSYIRYRTDDSPHFPLNGLVPQGKYGGERVSTTGYSLKGEARKLITNKWSIGLSAGIDKSLDYREFKAGLGFRYLVGGRSAVMP